MENGIGGHSEELAMSSKKDGTDIVDDSVDRNSGDMHGGVDDADGNRQEVRRPMRSDL